MKNTQSHGKFMHSKAQPRPQGHLAAKISKNLGDFGACSRVNFHSILIEMTPGVQRFHQGSYAFII